MPFDLKGRRALVTGASSGIGAALAEALAAAGATVGICARRADRLRETLERCAAHRPDSRMWVVDLDRAEDVDALARAAVEELGGVDLLVHSAGIPKRRHVTALDPGTVEHVMRVNFLAPVRLTLALLPQMLARGEGRVVVISSVAATLSSPGEAAYDASKAALSVFAEATAVDLWDTGIKVTIVYPGVVDTELFSVPDNDELFSPIDPIPVSEVVEAVLDGLAKDRLQTYVPAYFADLAAAKAAGVETFLEGSAGFVRQYRAGA